MYNIIKITKQIKSIIFICKGMGDTFYGIFGIKILIVKVNNNAIIEWVDYANFEIVF